MKKTVLQLLKSAVERFPDVKYVTEKQSSGWVGRSYTEVDVESKELAVGLTGLGLEREDKVSLISEGRSQWIISEYGILKAGGIVVPLSIKLLPEEVAFRVNHSQSKAIVVSSNIAEKVIAAWALFDNSAVIFIFLDTNTEYLAKLCEKYKVGLPEDIYTYSELVEFGKNASTALKDLQGGIEKKISEPDVATISYTSGTTGNPKGIMLTQQNYYENSYDAVGHFDTSTRLKTLLILPLDHSFAHTVGIYASCVRGLQLYFVDSRGSSMAALKNIPINLKEVNPDFLLTVPALTGNFMDKIKEGIAKKGGFIEMLFNEGLEAGIKINGNGYHKLRGFDKLKLWPIYTLANALIFGKLRGIFGSNLQYCVGGGALLDMNQQHFYYALGIPIYQGYGLSEATPIISANSPAFHKMGTSGGVLPTIDCRIQDGDDLVMSAGQKGEIVIKGKNVMKGYYRNQKATDEAIKGEWLHTGDLGYFDKDGFLVVTGREKALLISQDGEKYSPEGIEEAMHNASSAIFQVMLYNDHSRFTSSVVTVNVGYVLGQIEKRGIKTAKELLDYIKAESLCFKKMDEYKNQFPAKWVPSVFALIEEPFTEKNHMINSTLKMVRYRITEAYRGRIDNLYGAEGAQVHNSENLDVVEKLFGLK